MKITKALDNMSKGEFVALLWRLCTRYAPTKFPKDFTSKDLKNPLKPKYHKYLVA